MHARLLAWSLRHRKWRHILNGVTIAITVSVVMLFTTVLAELVGYFHVAANRELTRVLIRPTMGNDLPLALYDTLKRIDGVQVVLHFRGFAGRHPSGATYIIAGEEDDALALTQDIFPVEPQVVDAWKKARPMGAIMTDDIARDLRLKAGDTAEIPTSIGPLRIQVVGLSHNATVKQRIVVHYDYIRDLGPDAGTCLYKVWCKPADFDRVARAIEDTTKNSATPLVAINGDSDRRALAKRASTIPAVLGFLGLLLLVTTSLTLANTAAIAIRKRRGEIATMRVLGYHRRTILRMFVSEATFVGLAGGAVGIVLTTLLCRGGVQLTPSHQPVLQPIEIGWPGIVAGLVVAIAIPLLGSLPSTLATVRMPLSKALRDT